MSMAQAFGTPKRRLPRNRRDGASDAHGASEERWLLTYADMITLLLVLFIVLFALSRIDQAKYQAFKESVTKDKDVSGLAAQGPATAQGSHSATQAMAPTNPPSQLHKIEIALSKALEKQGLLGDVTLAINSTGLVEGLVADSTFFVTDSAALSPIGEQIVDTSGHVLRGYTNDVEVAGYTDNEPIRGGVYADNWALSAGRSATVVQRLATVDDVNPAHLVALGYGQYHPAKSNTTATGRAENRRVDIVVTKRSVRLNEGLQ